MEASTESRVDRTLTSLALFPRAPEGIHSEIEKHQGEHGGQEDPAAGGGAGRVAMVFARRCAAANHAQHDEQEARDFEPEGMEHVSHAGDGGTAATIEGADPAVLAGLSPGDPP